MVDVEYPVETLFTLAEASLKAGHYDVAERYLLESVRKSKLIGNEILESWGYNGWTSLEMQRGNFNNAKKYCEQMIASDPLSEASKNAQHGST